MTGWKDNFRALIHPRVITMLFYGLSAGIPLLLIFSSLGLWLREAGVDRSTATFFSWAALGYSFKFVWAPIVDKLPLPYISRKLGRRRSWILLSQSAIIVSIFIMASIDPSASINQLQFMALASVMLGFSSATQDIVIDAYRIESAPAELQALMASTYTTGYRLGMLISGAGSLYIASTLGSELNSYNYTAWQTTYMTMATFMLIGIITTLVINEPEQNKASDYRYSNSTYIRFFMVFVACIAGLILTYNLGADVANNWKQQLNDLLNNSVLANFCIELLRIISGIMMAILITSLFIRFNFIERKVAIESYVEPITDFFNRYGLKLALLILTLICLYRISDIVLGVIAQIFYQDLGYSKKVIAPIMAFGVVMTIIGGLMGGLLSMRYGIVRILFLGAFLTVLTNLMFMLLASYGQNLILLYMVIFADNLSAGIASAAFIAFLSRLTNISFTAMQYAIFSSLMTLLPKTIGGYSGSIVENIGYMHFFLFASLLGVPVLGIIWLANRHLKFE